MKTIRSRRDSSASSPKRNLKALNKAKVSRNTDNWIIGEHDHKWHPIGAHSLEAGCKPKKENPYPDRRIPIREIRTVFLCKYCPEVKVSISRHFCYGKA